MLSLQLLKGLTSHHFLLLRLKYVVVFVVIAAFALGRKLCLGIGGHRGHHLRPVLFLIVVVIDSPRGGGGGSAGVLHSSDLCLVNFACVFDVEVAIFVVFF